LSGRVTYGYDRRYLAEANFGYNASERFNTNNRWGFFPSVGLAWNLAEEEFMKPTKKYLDNFKIRISYGVVGNDNLTDWINYGGTRYFFIDRMNIPDYNSIYFGTDATKGYKLISVSQYGNDGITWEKSYKSNLAFEIGLFGGLNLEFDFFNDKATNILMVRSDLPANMGLLSTVSANVGEMKSKGFEGTLNYNKNLTKDIWLSLRSTVTYSTNKTTVYEEPDYPDNMKYLSRVGYNWNTPSGLIAERLFIDEEDVNNSPRQFGSYSYMAGDIKYHDVNGDGIIDNNDMVKMGYPTTPELVYGAGFSLGYKDFDVSAFFQGQARTSFMIDPVSIMPFYDHQDGKINGLLKVIADDHWSEADRNPYAFYPRLSTTAISNNNQPSSWWLRDGSFLRLKNVEIGYEPKGEWVKKKTGLGGFRIYVTGMNLFTVSKFNLWDVEMKGNGLGYPLQRVFNAGVQVNF
jgi:TonB-linked SusC/RagA family outer membrane protein